MGTPSANFVQTQKWCTIIMFIVSTITLAKVIKSTHKSAQQYVVLYAILSLSVLTWFLILLTFITTNKVIYCISLSYTAVQDLEIWLFAWSYYIGIRSTTSSLPMTGQQILAWKVANGAMWITTMITITVYCVFNYKESINGNGSYTEKV